MSKADPPQPPNPLQTAAATTATNVSTAVANAYLNNVNQNTPQGSLTYTTGTPYSWTDPTTGQTYSIPRFTSNQTQSPEQSQLYFLNNQTQQNLANIGANQSGAIGGLLDVPFDPTRGNFNAQAYLAANPDVAAAAANARSNVFDAQAYLDAYPDVAAAAKANNMDPVAFARQHYDQFGRAEGRTAGFAPVNPAAYAAQNYMQSGRAGGFTGSAPMAAPLEWMNTAFPTFSFDPRGQQQTTFDSSGLAGSGNIVSSYGPNDYSQDRANVEQALYQRMDPQLQRDRAALDARLADQGITIGSAAYQAAHDQFERQLTDTRLGITQTAGQEQQRMQQMAQAQAQFKNQAQQQAFLEAQQRGTFANAAQAANFQQSANQAQFYNQAAQQQLARNQASFNAANQLRNQWLTEQYAQRAQPINEITALMSGSQVSRPNFVTTPQTQIANTDTAGIINSNFAQQMAAAQMQNQQTQQLLGGIFGFAGGMLSDRREKENIQKMGSVLATGGVQDADQDEVKKLPIYQYSYKDDPMSTRHIGPMAQDVEKIDPRAVKTRAGKKYIDVTRLGSILRA